MRKEEGESRWAISSHSMKWRTYSDLLCFRPAEELNGSVRDFLKKEVKKYRIYDLKI